MAKGYKLRLGDGSEIGPMDLQGVRDWYRQGLVNKSSLVLRPGSNRWVPLTEVLTELAPARSTPSPTRAAAPSRLGSGSRWNPSGLVKTLVLSGIVVLLLGAGAWLASGLLRGGAGDPRILAASASERELSDGMLDMQLKLPAGWRLLRSDQTLLSVPEGTRAAFGHPRGAGLGYLAWRPAPAAGGVEPCLDAVVADLRKAAPSYSEAGRQDVKLGQLGGREVEARWEASGGKQQGIGVVARDGNQCATLIAFIADDGGPSLGELHALRDGLALGGGLAAHRAEAVKRATAEVPQLSPAAAEIVMAESDAKVLEPESAFLHAYDLANRGTARLTPAESRELGGLITEACGFLSATDRNRLMVYFQRIREHRLTTPEDNREMAQLMKTGVLKLSPARRARLQALYEKAIRNAVGL